MLSSFCFWLSFTQKITLELATALGSGRVQNTLSSKGKIYTFQTTTFVLALNDLPNQKNEESGIVTFLL